MSLSKPTRWMVAICAVGLVPLPACTQQPAATSGAVSAEQSILVSSTPAAGATVGAPVNNLELRFNPPARLHEVTVTGPDGLMPTMVTAVGEVATYSIPLSGLGAGSYTVQWRATVRQREHRGTFSFTVQG